ncbi:serine/threonine-protein kinase, partial [Oceanispirochaeta sp.]|uniref:serine/threonine protein kinase n=1 Tax=Oceanispirochaeta sp. TaxID=2035350 RepID=UPI00261C8460
IGYLGLHPTLKRKVVLKKLNLRGKKSFYDRFLQEAALMMDLNHDHIVKVYDHFKEGSRHFMVMEFVEGASLDRIIEQSGPLNHETIRYILRCCCKALNYIHDRKIIHRDIKPSNIFISQNGDVKLGDFGIAMLEDPADHDEQDNRVEHPLIGTPSYMAPEQFSGHGKITLRTDLYALGVSYYELLTNRKLFEAETLEDMRRAVLKGRHPSLLFLIRSYGISSWLIIRRCIFRVPLLRYPSSFRVLKALSSFRMNDESSIEDLSRRIRTLTSQPAFKGKTRKINGNSGFSQVLGVKKKSRKTFLITLLFLFLMIVVLSGLLFGGHFYQWFLPEQVGGFSFELYQEGQGEAFPLKSLELFREEGSSLKSLEIWDHAVFSGNSFYKKSGFYRLKANWGNRVVWKSFYLPPLSVQGRTLVIELTAPPLQSRPMDVKLILTDTLTGEPLSPEGHVFIRNSKGDWYPLTRDTTVVSGFTYQIKAGFPGYYESTFNISPEFYQDDLILEAALRPYPGQLDVHHNMDRLKLRVNGKKILQGGLWLDSKGRFGTLATEGNSWPLPPGIYELTWSGAGWKKHQKLTIRTGELVVYRITQDNQGLPHFDIDRRVME